MLIVSRTLRFSTPLISLKQQHHLLTFKNHIPNFQIKNQSSFTTSSSGISRWLGTAVAVGPDEPFAFRNITLDEILNSKVNKIDVQWIVEDELVIDVVKFMSRTKIGAVLVQDAEGKFAGIFSERDYLNMSVKGLDEHNSPVKKVMTKQTSFIKSNETLLSCMVMMNQFGFRHLPVKHHVSNEIIGMVSIRDILKLILSNPAMPKKKE